MWTKLCFLDIDGVLNHSQWYLNNGSKGNFDPLCIERLNRITDETGAKIVLSTSWRTEKDIEERLKRVGITGEIIGKTPTFVEFKTYSGACRGNEIQAWLENFYDKNNIVWDENMGEWSTKHKITYVILDDCDDILLSQINNFIHTDYKIGLTDELVDKAIEILNTK